MPPAAAVPDEHAPSHPADRVAGLAALLAATDWIAWVALNTAMRGALDGPRDGANAPWGWLGTLLLVLWTVGPIPAALVLARRLRPLAPRAVPLATAAGVASLALWALAALTGWWPRGLEPAFLVLSALWWCGIATPLRRQHPKLGVLTLVLGVAAFCDAVVTAGEGRLPAWAFPVLGGAKLPLQLAWTVSVGIVLLRGRPAASGAPRQRAAA